MVNGELLRIERWGMWSGFVRQEVVVVTVVRTVEVTGVVLAENRR